MKNTIRIDRPARPRVLTTLFSLATDADAQLIPDSPPSTSQLSLTVDRMGEVGVLTWQAPIGGHEGDFILEHSPDGIHWQLLGSRNIPPEGTDICTYRFNDSCPETQLNYYRLQHVSPNGQLLWNKVAVLAFSPGYNLSWYTVDRSFLKVDMQEIGREKYRLSGKDGSVTWGLLQNGRATIPLPASGDYEIEVFPAAGAGRTAEMEITGTWKRQIAVPLFETAPAADPASKSTAPGTFNPFIQCRVTAPTLQRPERNTALTGTDIPASAVALILPHSQIPYSSPR